MHPDDADAALVTPRLQALHARNGGDRAATRETRHERPSTLRPRPRTGHARPTDGPDRPTGYNRPVARLPGTSEPRL